MTVLYEDNHLIIVNKQAGEIVQGDKTGDKSLCDTMKQYIKEKGYHVDAEAFFAYYDSVGWMVGNHHMQSWKSAVVTWEKRDRKPVARSGTTDDFDSNAYLLNIINEGG